ncbi:MCE family protein [Nocardioides sp.]|jgi:phospholipid/cholesterol/gamma-HCH transport system substrate-binding protein|uniref:MCE family protein n=1 Tax=Nocardioides sp. TaxID=35761 RepID=UPI002C7622AE|nr:MCE family protein [Nocardioides sp.]HVX54030.1 MCE family protein [Nocardioides sp.]
MSRISRARALDATLGLGYVVVIVAFLAAVVLVYNKAFTHRTDITLTTTSMGNALEKGSDVKYHGVPVGTVTQIVPAGHGARLTLALDPSVAKNLPSTTTALLLPKTLFGERYVDLVAPTGATPGGLHAGATIAQDSSDEAVQLQDVFDHMLPMLQALEPQKLAATLGELAAMLRGEGDAIGDDMASWAAYFRKINPEVPQMTSDFAALGKVADEYADAVPDLLNALDTMTTTSATLASQQTQLSQVFATVTSAGDTTTGWMNDNSQTITVLSKQSRKALAAVAPYASEFPCLLKATADYVPVMDKTLGKGTKEPGMHVVLNVEPSRGKYVAGKDKPVRASGGPRCPYETGQSGTKAAPRTAASATDPADVTDTPSSAPTSTPSSTPTSTPTGTARHATTTTADDQPPTIPAPPSDALEQQVTSAATGLGQVNSPAENQMIAELVAPTVGLSPSAYPDWGSLLIGPLLRGAEVTLK